MDDAYRYGVRIRDISRAWWVTPAIIEKAERGAKIGSWTGADVREIIACDDADCKVYLAAKAFLAGMPDSFWVMTGYQAAWGYCAGTVWHYDGNAC